MERSYAVPKKEARVLLMTLMLVLVLIAIDLLLWKGQRIVNAFVVMVSVGVYGGVVNYYISQRPSKNKKNSGGAPTGENADKSQKADEESEEGFWEGNLVKCMIVGVGAAMLVPVFLYLIKGDLIKELLDTPMSAGPSATPGLTMSPALSPVPSLTPNPVVSPVPSPTMIPDMGVRWSMDGIYARSILVFAGYCLIASISSGKFIDMLSSSIFKKVEEIRQEAKEAQNVAAAAEEHAKDIKMEFEKREPAIKAAERLINRIAEQNPDKLKEKIPGGGNEDSRTRVLRSLVEGEEFAFRSAKVIANEKRLEEEEVLAILKDLISEGSMDKVETFDGDRYYITKEGYNKLT